MNKSYLGIDIGSTTVKFYLTDENHQLIDSAYVRHYSDVRATILNILEMIHQKYGNILVSIVMTGSGGLSIAQSLDITFMQEVIACTKTVEHLIPQTDVAIELGGEDAKITYFEGSMEQRMNGTCAGGTGAFIDQMAVLLQTDAQGLNQLALSAKNIYPIASRCGVFAKSDIQPLINEGVSKEDIAASIFQAVVNQTISGLACGKPIRGKIAFLGGPLTFLDQLRYRFIETLKIKPADIIIPNNGQLFVAMGANIQAYEKPKYELLKDVITNFSKISATEHQAENNLLPLFNNQKDLDEFRARHQLQVIEKVPIEKASDKLYLGIDVGSTTTKCVIIDDMDQLVYTSYSSNCGKPLDLMIDILKNIYRIMPSHCRIYKAGVTGYGESLIKTALNIDISEVETIAHYTAAKTFDDDVDFILDIGGQDMKAIVIRDNCIQNITLNEACSSGCGSFLETFAHSLNYDIKEFSKMALLAPNPVDLGSRCTVFMNTKVKQAQKEGASIENISAGLSYSVIKNALYKVIKLKRKEDIGKHVIVQGGTFYNEAVLRAFELETGIQAHCPNISGLMGAYGMAKLAMEAEDGLTSTILSATQLDALTYTNKIKHCGKCTNNCLLTITNFNDQREFISGNRCEKGANIAHQSNNLPNLYAYKYARLFNYQPLADDLATRKVVGIPRVLNMYENYPFWFTFFTELKFKVVLSSSSSKKIYEKGMETIPSESVCYPAKIAHGHIEDLIEKQVPFIFYPSVIYERSEFKHANNHFNCPIVGGYPEVIRTNVDTLEKHHIIYKNPYISLNNPKTLFNNLKATLQEFAISDSELKMAIDKAYLELNKAQSDIKNQGMKALDYMRQNKLHGIVLAGRPYHIDPEINHGIAQLIKSEGFVVFTEDSLAHLSDEAINLRVVDQWVYHSRLYRCANYVSQCNDLDLIQLTSFGCGLDAVTSDQVAEILQQKNKIYTMIKIDEVSNLGTIRIRVRSLKATINKHRQAQNHNSLQTNNKAPFTKDMKNQGYTILCPQMSPIHFQFIETAMISQGYNFKVLPSIDAKATDQGLKYVNNDACYPSILVVGQMMNALNSGEYDLNKVALIISQTGGGCRATNYLAFIRKALKDAHMEHIPVISANLLGMEQNPGFKITLSMAKKLAIGGIYGDLFMRVLYRVRPYEKVQGSAEKLYHDWVAKCQDNVKNGSLAEFKRNVYQIVNDFDNLELNNITKPRIGLVGEILVKFHPTANNEIVKLIESEGGEAVMPDFLNFFQYSFYNVGYKQQHYDGTWLKSAAAKSAIAIIDYLRRDMSMALEQSKRFEAPYPIDDLANKTKEVISLGNQTGEGWFLTGEMIELIESGAPNIVCMQPFACLPNHITGKGIIKELRKRYPQSNIVAIDFDPGASSTNQLNRIKLMLATAFKNLQAD